MSWLSCYHLLVMMMAVAKASAVHQAQDVGQELNIDLRIIQGSFQRSATHKTGITEPALTGLRLRTGKTDLLPSALSDRVSGRDRATYIDTPTSAGQKWNNKSSNTHFERHRFELEGRTAFGLTSTEFTITASPNYDGQHVDFPENMIAVALGSVAILALALLLRLSHPPRWRRQRSPPPLQYELFSQYHEPPLISVCNDGWEALALQHEEGLAMNNPIEPQPRASFQEVSTSLASLWQRRAFALVASDVQSCLKIALVHSSMVIGNTSNRVVLGLLKVPPTCIA
eukprot:m.191413 g.191413  ORF g.191413 m.191413 type:complete len:285 (+) comp16954_c0_seq37:2871-3725(+)